MTLINPSPSQNQVIHNHKVNDNVIDHNLNDLYGITQGQRWRTSTPKLLTVPLKINRQIIKAGTGIYSIATCNCIVLVGSMIFMCMHTLYFSCQYVSYNYVTINFQVKAKWTNKTPGGHRRSLQCVQILMKID